MCHGVASATNTTNKIQNAKTASKTLTAIANNTGGMSFLSSSIKSAEATDIANYLSSLK